MTDENTGKCKYQSIPPINPPYFNFLVECINNKTWTLNPNMIPDCFKTCFHCKKPIKLLNMDDYECIWEGRICHGLNFSDTYYPYFTSKCGHEFTLPCSGKWDDAERMIKQGEEIVKRHGDKCHRCGGKIIYEGKS